MSNVISTALRKVRNSRYFQVATSSSIYMNLHVLTDSAAVRFCRTSRRTGGSGTVIFAPTGGGNIGDQALVEAAFDQIAGEITLVVGSKGAILIPKEQQSRTRELVLSGYNYLPAIVRLPSVIRTYQLCVGASAVYVVGADLMDGTYNPIASLARSSTLWLSARAGTPARLLGCSWSENHLDSCFKNLKRASDAGAVISVRDPISLERVRKKGLLHAQLTADIVFLSEDKSMVEQKFYAWMMFDEKPLVVVNASGLVGRRLNQVAQYVEVIDYLRSRGYKVVLLPHVFRSAGDDMAECDKIINEASSSDVFYFRKMLTPSQVREICDHSSLVITGRMHLAVMGLSAGTPVVTLGTHGKVEGMYEHFGLAGLCVDPYGQKLGLGIIAAVNRVLANKEIDATISNRLPIVKLLALNNFSSDSHLEQ